MTAGAEYLPPIVTELKGDASDLLRAFGEAEAAQKAFEKASKKTGDDFGKSTDKMGKDADDFSRLVTKRMRTGEAAMVAMRREANRLQASITSMRKAMGKGGDDDTLFRNIRAAEADLRKLQGFAQSLAPDLDLLSGAVKGVGSAAAKSGPGMFIMAMGIAALGLPIGGVVAALADLVGLVVLVPSALAVLLAAIVPVVLAFQNFGDAISAISSGDIDKINEAMKKLSPSARSVAREVGKLLPQLRRLQRAAQEGFFQPLRGVLTTLTRNLLPSMRFWFREIASAAGELVSKLLIFLSQPKAVAGLNRLFASTVRIMRQWMDVSIALFTGMGKAVLALLPSLENINKWLAGSVKAFGEWLGRMADSGKLKEWLDDALATLSEVWDLTKAIGDLFSTLFASFDDSGRGFIGSLTDMVTKLDEFFESAEGQQVLKDGAETLKLFGSALVDVIGFLAWANTKIIEYRNWVAGIPDWISRAVDSGLTWLGKFFSTIGAWFSALPGKVGAWISKIPGVVSTWLASAAERAGYWVGFLVGTAVRLMMELPGKVATAASNLWTTVQRWFSRTHDSAVSWIARAITNVVAWLKGLPGKAATELSVFKNRVLAFFKGAPGWLYNAGKDIVRGLVNGLKSMWNWAIGQAKDFANGIAKGFKDALGIGSPSRLFAQFGRWSGQGYVDGLMGTMDAVRQTWSKMLTAPGSDNPYAVTSRAAASLATSSARTQSAGPSIVHTTLNVDGREFARAVTPAVQRAGNRSSTTGFSSVSPAGYAVAR